MNRELHLLIVDDNIATRYALRRRLDRQGYQVMEAGTGTEGLALIASEHFDALILDVNLPDMSGFDIVRQLRSNPETSLLPVIHVSAASIQTGDIITGLEAGADAYLIHPVDPDVLLATLRTLLRVRDTENALRESEARFREIFSTVSAPIAVLDANLTVHECNQAFKLLLQGDVDAQTLRECLADNAPSVIGELRLRLADGERWQGTLNMRVRDAVRETEWQVSPYRTPGSSLVFVEDVTEHRERERSHQAQLEDANTLLAKEVAERARTEEQLLQAQKMDALGKLTGGIAHDFNNMLTGIITSLELISKQMQTQPVGKVLAYAEAALNSATSAAALTHRLLAFARQQPLDTRPIDINEHIRSLEELIIRTVGERIDLKLELTDEPAVALVDPVQLESALLNLVINARDALPQGGTIWVSTRPARSRGNAKLQDGAYVSLSVRDDGIGIDHSVIDKVFEPFFTTKPLGQGTGLGLSTIYGFARQSGGDAHIHSVVGRGTEVTLVLPAGGPASAPVAEPQKVNPQGHGEHVLIVEDMASVRMFVGEVMMDAGYRCTSVETIELALEHLQKDPSIELLLTDVGLPRMSGRDLADVARGWRPTLPVLFMTGYAQTAVNRQAFLAPGMDMLLKPFQIGELLDKVRRALDSGVTASPQAPQQG